MNSRDNLRSGLNVALSRLSCKTDAAYRVRRLWRTAAWYKSRSMAGQIGKSREFSSAARRCVSKRSIPARRSCATPKPSRFAADNPAHRRIVGASVRHAHVLFVGSRANRRMAAISARARISDRLACHRGKPGCVVEFAARRQSGMTQEPAKLQQQTAVKIELEVSPSVRRPTNASPNMSRFLCLGLVRHQTRQASAVRRRSVWK
jgi:hypothetical protein